MEIIFRAQDAELERVHKIMPNAAFIGVLDEVRDQGWNPVELFPLDQVRGFYICRFVEIDLANPDAFLKDRVWELTGNEVTLVGRFMHNGFWALVPD